MRIKPALFALAALTALPVTAMAQDIVSTAGGWEIYRDASMGNGCFMMSQFEDGSVVQLGYDAAEDITFLSFLNTEWSEVTADGVYTLDVALDGKEWAAEGLGINDGSLGGVLLPIEDENFIVDLAEKKTLRMSYEGDEVIAIDLSGTHDAVLATVECMAG